MKSRMMVVTLGVANLERALGFYRDGLGLPTKGIVGAEFEHGAVAFFELRPGVKLAIWPRSSLAHDSGLPCETSGGISLGCNVGSREEVDEVIERARRAGGKVAKEAQETFWGGYSGYFQDPDGHLWEIVWNPHEDEL